MPILFEIKEFEKLFTSEKKLSFKQEIPTRLPSTQDLCDFNLLISKFSAHDRRAHSQVFFFHVADLLIRIGMPEVFIEARHFMLIPDHNYLVHVSVIDVCLLFLIQVV